MAPGHSIKAGLGLVQVWPVLIYEESFSPRVENSAKISCDLSTFLQDTPGVPSIRAVKSFFIRFSTYGYDRRDYLQTLSDSCVLSNFSHAFGETLVAEKCQRPPTIQVT
jgi:hypothetical protein